ncbi:MAG TPA: hypothetical protein VNU49_08330 [Opitutaceae bacterium]|nr:hypothetical protein [Opitutaceae bacterium]
MKHTTLVGFQLAAVLAGVALMLVGIVARAHADAFIGSGSVLALLALVASDYRTAGWRRALGK